RQTNDETMDTISLKPESPDGFAPANGSAATLAAVMRVHAANVADMVDEFPGRDVAWVSSSPHIVAEMTVSFRRKKDALKTKLLTPFYDG
ncbi:hypothetical protein U2242_15245, partial [Listeria monocytogenes]|uniref:hypothetical protein n=1 Tax=Listeria monocytogenes TaxID=1639 RepID=UPI002FDC4B77